MSDDIVELKPGIGPLKINLRALLRKFSNRGLNQKNPVELMAKRFLHLFEIHDITVSQIQRFIPSLTPDKLLSLETLLPELTTENNKLAADYFGVKIGWLEGESDRIYEYKSCYSIPELFFEELQSVNSPENKFVIHCIATTNQLNYQRESEQLLGLILKEHVICLEDKEIIRYRIFSDVWDWNHKKGRIQLKAMIRKAHFMTERPVPIHQIPRQILEKILEGKLIPSPYVSGPLLTSPSLEDFVLYDKESGVAKEIGELQEVEEFILNRKL